MVAEPADEAVRLALRATDPEAAAAALGEYSQATVRAPARRPFELTLHAFALGTMRYGETSISVSSVRTEPCPIYLLTVPMRGSLVGATDNSRDVVRGTERALISPGARVDAQYLRDVVIRSLSFDTRVVRGELSALLGRSIEVPPLFDLALRPGPALRVVEHAVGLLHDELHATSPLLLDPTFATRMSQMIVSALLLSQPHSHSVEVERRSRFEGPRAIRSLLERMEAAPMDFVTVGDLAMAAGLSVRALEEAFRRHVGRPPMTHLRLLRLQAAHDELVHADAEHTTVTMVARRWGFAHFGRFAARYRERYGVTPQEDLKGPRGAIRP